MLDEKHINGYAQSNVCVCNVNWIYDHTRNNCATASGHFYFFSALKLLQNADIK